jgi:peptidoglycan/LPS O-acetylase OafA/YrhL
MMPARAPQPTSPNWIALLTAILLVAPFVRALWQVLQADDTGLAANGDVLLFGAVIAAVLIGDSLRFGRPTRAFLLTLAGCLAAIGTGSAVFAIGVQFDVEEARQLGSLTIAGPLLALACAGGARLCLKKAFPDDIGR